MASRLSLQKDTALKHLDVSPGAPFRLLNCSTGRSCFLFLQVCGNLLQQQEKTHTVYISDSSPVVPRLQAESSWRSPGVGLAPGLGEPRAAGG